MSDNGIMIVWYDNGTGLKPTEFGNMCESKVVYTQDGWKSPKEITLAKKNKLRII